MEGEETIQVKPPTTRTSRQKGGSELRNGIQAKTTSRTLRLLLFFPRISRTNLTGARGDDSSFHFSPTWLDLATLGL